MHADTWSRCVGPSRVAISARKVRKKGNTVIIFKRPKHNATRWASMGGYCAADINTGAQRDLSLPPQQPAKVTNHNLRAMGSATFPGIGFVSPCGVPLRGGRQGWSADSRYARAASGRRRVSVMGTVDATRVGRAQEVLRELLAGNKRFAGGEGGSQAELSGPWLRRELAEQGQRPSVAVVGCADSRVAPEIVFGKGIGELFVVRNAGNVVWDDCVVGSLEFGCGVLGVCLVVVMGHSGCGAVEAAVKGAGGVGEGVLGRFVGRLREVVKGVGGVGEGVVVNVRDGVRRLKEGGGVVGDLVEKGEVLVVGAVYDMESGEVYIVEQ